jgi:RNA polymerase sigma-70 factor (ECF subfamily)
MTPDSNFTAFVARIRAGDATAAEELVRKYEPAIRVICRAHLSSGLRRQFDSMDVCQSVMGTFFARAALGQYDLNDPKELIALLVRMTRNKLASQARYHQRDRRDARRGAGAEALDLAMSPDLSPDRIAEGRDLLQRLRHQLGIEEREIADRRADGQEWVAIAAAMGGTADGRRKQLARAIDRLAPELGLIEGDDV